MKKVQYVAMEGKISLKAKQKANYFITHNKKNHTSRQYNKKIFIYR